MIALTDVASGWGFCLINDSANHWRREKKQKRSADCPSSFHQVQRGDWILTQVWSLMFEVSVTEWHWSRSFSAVRGLFTCRFPNLKPLYFWWDANMKCPDQHLVETIILRTLLWKLATPVLIKVQHQDLLLLFLSPARKSTEAVIQSTRLFKTMHVLQHFIFTFLWWQHLSALSGNLPQLCTRCGSWVPSSPPV